MSHELTLKEIKKEWRGSYKSYLIGFLLSLFFTCLAFFFAISGVFGQLETTFTVIFLGASQAIFQLIFFLHLGQEASPKWETIAFFLMLTVFVIIVAGSLWIMNDLDMRMMSGVMKEMHHG